MYLKIVLSSFFLLFLQHLARVIYNMDYHRVVYNHLPGPCQLVSGVEYGSEDMQTLSNGLTFITSGLLSHTSPKSVHKYHEKHNIKGKILLFDFNHPENDVFELKISKEFDQDTFHPHGISILEDQQSGRVILFVVNHLPGFDTIEKFQFEPEENLLQHIQTYTDPAIHFANDVLATGENSFYFTNYAHFRGYWSHMMEIILDLPFGNIMYFDGNDYKLASDGLLLPNGLALSWDGKTVYAATSLTKDLKVFRRESDNTLELVQQVPLYSAVDNPTVEPETGNILIGAHPVMYQLAETLHFPEIPAPSQVLYLYTNSTNHVTFVTELYSDACHTLYGSTVASMYQKKMLIGTILHKLMYCEVRTL
ncbi:hypothetical protein CHS0354_036314 [Potamilus streckersoni]|uniref:Paraoxonase n=1 Tax=Potamilus streckersoni TaxID=2493646 RepID=A0AAE0T8Q7_9BIVA|nr:hypothetical protein CHS0354_036314 [Potamilus streckersoni]